ncbi:MAG TPA: YlxR family protein [Pilimelia sp.]|nr:YlxR family protein [Pilimelia sp.]
MKGRPAHPGTVADGPVRTCIGCRQRAPASQLVRVVARDAGEGWLVQPDPRRRLSGRGAHLHPDPACLALAERRRAFGRAFRRSGVPDPGPLAEHLRRSVCRRSDTDGAGPQGAPETAR